MAQEHRKDYRSLWATVQSLAPKFGCVPQTLYEWVKRAEIDAGDRADTTSEEAERIKTLERENKELRRANEILRTAIVFCSGGARPQAGVVNAYIDEYRDAYGVEPICGVLQVALSAYRRHAAR